MFVVPIVVVPITMSCKNMFFDISNALAAIVKSKTLILFFYTIINRTDYFAPGGLACPYYYDIP
jgi:hypothetical protein